MVAGRRLELTILRLKAAGTNLYTNRPYTRHTLPVLLPIERLPISWEGWSRTNTCGLLKQRRNADVSLKRPYAELNCGFRRDKPT